MRVLLLDQFSDPGGAQQCLLDTAAALRDRGWDALAGMPGEGKLCHRLRQMRVPVERISCGPYASGGKTAGDAARFLVGTPRLAGQIRRLADAFGADAIHINGPRLLPAAMLAGLRAPVVFHTHSLVTSPTPRRLAAVALRRLDAWLLASCDFTARQWRQSCRTDRTRVVYNGVAGPPAGWKGKSGGAPRIGCIGRIAPEKGQLEFLLAARAIYEQMPECRFAVYGATLFDEPRAQAYERAVHHAAEGLPVEFQGWIDDVYKALARLDLLLVPSAAHEATTRVILEAFAAGVPAIAFRSGGICEVIEGGNGLLVDSAAAMAARAIELLRAPRECASMARAARASWERRFTLQRYGSAVAEFVAGAANSRRNRPADTTASAAAPQSTAL